MVDTSYFDDYIPSDKQRLKEETELLIPVAQNVGNYYYEYKDAFKNAEGANQGMNVGIMAQELQKVPGLSSCVIQNPDGILTVDGNRLALSAMGYVATLAKLVLQMRGIEYDNTTEAVPDAVRPAEGGDSAAETAATADQAQGGGYPQGDKPAGPAAETADTPIDVYESAIKGGQ